MDEVTFDALGDALGDNKLTIDTVSADFQFEAEASQASTQSTTGSGEDSGEA